MRIIGSLIGNIVGIVCMLLMIVAFIPMLGWLNWVVIPVSAVGLIISSIAGSSGGKTMCGFAIAVGTARLMWGGGIL